MRARGRFSNYLSRKKKMKKVRKRKKKRKETKGHKFFIEQARDVPYYISWYPLHACLDEVPTVEGERYNP